MKKLLITLAGVCCTSMAFAATTPVKCSSLAGGLWQGNLGNLTNVTLSINSAGGKAINGHAWFNYDSGAGSAELDMLQGTCVENADGTATLTLNRDSYGVSGNVSATATNDKTLSVKSFSYNDPWDHFSGSGTLTRN